MLSFLFFFYCSSAHRYLHSFPTRRSSDLYCFWAASLPSCCGFHWPFSSCSWGRSSGAGCEERKQIGVSLVLAPKEDLTAICRSSHVQLLHLDQRRLVHHEAVALGRVLA